MITTRNMFQAATLIHRDGKANWIESFSIAYKLMIFYNMADELNIEYEKSGLYFKRVLNKNSQTHMI